MSHKIAFVVPRFSEKIGGGAETLVRSLALKLASAGQGNQIEVWTTCALDHRSWENHFLPAVSDDSGVTVRRFLVDLRDLEVFIPFELDLQAGGTPSVQQQLAWHSENVNSRDLYGHIVARSDDFDAVVFAPYLFATSFWGALLCPKKAILLPCLHDERYAYLDIMQHLFQSVAGFIFNANAERELAARIYNLDFADQPAAVVGMGFELPEAGDVEKQHFERPYLLYSGRKETGKNLDLLLDYFEGLGANPPLDLRLIGSGEIEFRDSLPACTYDHGFVSEQEKRELMAGAAFLCQPSVNESFSIVLMEAWAEGTPVLVHEHCAVTLEHVLSSNGGLYFSNRAEFAAVVERFIHSGQLRDALGAAGRKYVEQQYSWDAVLARFETAIDEFKSRRGGSSERRDKRQAERQ